MKTLQDFTFNTQGQVEQRLVLLENQMRDLSSTLNNFYLKGRLRTDRTSPSSSNDVQLPDKIYDRVVDKNYEYILINNSGTLKWMRISISMY